MDHTKASGIDASTTVHQDSILRFNDSELEDWRHSVMNDKFYFLSQQSKKNRKQMLSNLPEFKAESKFQKSKDQYLTEDQRAQLDNIKKNKKRKT
jgi:CRISPR/Cas system-associated endonuclease/helicase Cas3